MRLAGNGIVTCSTPSSSALSMSWAKTLQANCSLDPSPTSSTWRCGLSWISGLRSRWMRCPSRPPNLCCFTLRESSPPSLLSRTCGPGPRVVPAGLVNRSRSVRMSSTPGLADVPMRASMVNLGVMREYSFCHNSRPVWLWSSGITLKRCRDLRLELRGGPALALAAGVSAAVRIAEPIQLVASIESRVGNRRRLRCVLPDGLQGRIGDGVTDLTQRVDCRLANAVIGVGGGKLNQVVDRQGQARISQPECGILALLSILA